jgi:hypothetical protein
MVSGEAGALIGCSAGPELTIEPEEEEEVLSGAEVVAGAAAAGWSPACWLLG